MTTDRQYHTIVRGRQQGPLSWDEMVQLAARGEIGPETMAWTDGMTIWRPLPEVPGLGDLLANLPEVPARDPSESLLPVAVDAALDRTTRSQAFIIGAGIFFGLIAILGIRNIFSFRELALLGFWGSAALAFFAYQAWRAEEGGDVAGGVMWSVRGAFGAWGLALVSLVFGNWFFAVLQAGAGVLFWMARVELLKQPPAVPVDDDQEATNQVGSQPAAESSQTDADVDEEAATEAAETPKDESDDESAHDPTSDV